MSTLPGYDEDGLIPRQHAQTFSLEVDDTRKQTADTSLTLSTWRSPSAPRAHRNRVFLAGFVKKLDAVGRRAGRVACTHVIAWKPAMISYIRGVRHVFCNKCLFRLIFPRQQGAPGARTFFTRSRALHHVGTSNMPDKDQHILRSTSY